MRYYFTGRSDGFDPNQNSGDPNDARFDTEGIRISNDGKSVFISDEYGPYVYQFDRSTGVKAEDLCAARLVFRDQPVSDGKYRDQRQHCGPHGE
jgi:hypothetical protein